MRRHAAKILALLLLPAAVARAGEPVASPAGATLARPAGAPLARPALEGIWTATKADGEVFRGTWSAEVVAATPNVAVGSWTLTNESGRGLMQGTWSARKAPRGWRGAWSARIAPTGKVVSGTWEADDSTLQGRKTFAELLRQTAVTQIAGAWRAGHARGNWWLKSLH
jgi:hypothetical protein